MFGIIMAIATLYGDGNSTGTLGRTFGFLGIWSDAILITILVYSGALGAVLYTRSDLVDGFIEMADEHFKNEDELKAALRVISVLEKRYPKSVPSMYDFHSDFHEGWNHPLTEKLAMQKPVRPGT